MSGPRRGGQPPRRLAGRDFGRLHVLGPAPRPAHTIRPGLWWWCECRCPARTLRRVFGDHLASGRVKSCGCLRRELGATLWRRRRKGGDPPGEPLGSARPPDSSVATRPADHPAGFFLPGRRGGAGGKP